VSAPLLLHSLSEFRALLLRCFEAAEARALVEIGSETGGFTRELLAFARERGGSLTSVEPLPAAEIVELDRADDAFRLVRGLSPAALAGIDAADGWIVDGDHNFWTVERELEAALALADRTGRPPLIVLHDVGWPCARRDFYYDPSALPPEAVHPHTFTRGIVPGDDGVRDLGGLRGEGELAVALHEGGERNGVLTAIEAVMDRRGDLVLAVIPAVYGVGVLYPAAAPWADAVAALVAPYDGLGLLDRLESNRLDLYLRVLELQDRLNRVDRSRNRVLATYDERIAALEAENARLRVDNARRREAA
jgi:hypothetical protein